MQNKIIYIDVDDTIALTRSAIVDYYRKLTDDYSTSASMKTNGDRYDLLCPQWTGERMRYAFMDPVFFKLLKKVPGATEGIQYLIDKGYDVHICTAHRPEGEDMKVDWIYENFPMVDAIHITRPFEGKDEYVGYAFLDDGIHNLVNNKSEIRLLFDIYGMLEPQEGMIMISNWEQIKEVL